MTAVEIVTLLRDGGLVIATAESCTGGMVSAALTDVPGSSKVFEAGFITYSNLAKQRFLDVSPATLSAHGAVSEEVAQEMALGAIRATGASLAISVTGIAGPGGSDFKPEGRVCFALAVRGGAHRSETMDFGALGRDKVRRAARDHALGIIGAYLTLGDMPPRSGKSRLESP